MSEINTKVANCWLHKLDNRQFKMVTRFGKNGKFQTISGEVKGQRASALKSLNKALEDLNIPLPGGWKVNEVDPEVTAQLLDKETPKSESVTFDARDEAPSLDNPDDVECENPFNGPAPQSTAPKAPRTDHGMVTPVSDRDTWVEIYKAAVSVAIGPFLEETREEDFGPDNNRVTRFREMVNQDMKAVGCVGAFELTPGGDRWIRFVPELVDPTVKVPRNTSRRRNHTDINGNKTTVEHSKAKSKPVPRRSASTYTYTGGSEEDRKAAYNFAAGLAEKEAKRISKVQGIKLWKAKKDISCRSHFMAGFLIAAKAMDLPPHTLYAQKLEQRGYTLEHRDGDSVLWDSEGKVVLSYHSGVAKAS